MGDKKKRVVKNTILLPSEVHQALRIEAITKKVSMGELIVQKLRELEEYKEKYGGVVKAEDYLIYEDYTLFSCQVRQGFQRNPQA